MTAVPSARDEMARRIRDLVAENELAPALTLLRALALQGPPDLADEAFGLSGRFAGENLRLRKGTTSDEAARVEFNRIRFAIQGLLVDLLRKLPPEAGPVPPVPPAEPFGDAKPPKPQAIIGINNLREIAWLERGLAASRAVCRVLGPLGMGTGFLIGPSTILTNNHVIPTHGVAEAARVEFAYQIGADGVPRQAVRYRLDPAARFRTDETLDFTAVAVAPRADGPPVSSWGALPLQARADPVAGELVAIVQHANGGLKQIALSANAVLQVKRHLLHYSTDTMPGSSGAPVFNDLWQVVALHRAEGPDVKTDDGYRYSNEGVLTSAIRPELGDL